MFVFQFFSHSSKMLTNSFHCSFVAAPWVFTIGYNFIKGIITKKTLEKIHIFGTHRDEWMAELRHKFPESSIIPELTSDVNGNQR